MAKRLKTDWILFITVILMVFFGAVWVLQGLNMAPPPFNGGFMIGDPKWTVYGAILALVGLGQAIWSIRRR